MGVGANGGVVSLGVVKGVDDGGVCDFVNVECASLDAVALGDDVVSDGAVAIGGYASLGEVTLGDGVVSDGAVVP